MLIKKSMYALLGLASVFLLACLPKGQEYSSDVQADVDSGENLYMYVKELATDPNVRGRYHRFDPKPYLEGAGAISWPEGYEYWYVGERIKYVEALSADENCGEHAEIWTMATGAANISEFVGSIDMLHKLTGDPNIGRYDPKGGFWGGTNDVLRHSLWTYLTCKSALDYAQKNNIEGITLEKARQCAIKSVNVHEKDESEFDVYARVIEGLSEEEVSKSAFHQWAVAEHEQDYQNNERAASLCGRDLTVGQFLDEYRNGTFRVITESPTEKNAAGLPNIVLAPTSGNGPELGLEGGVFNDVMNRVCGFKWFTPGFHSVKTDPEGWRHRGGAANCPHYDKNTGTYKTFP